MLLQTKEHSESAYLYQGPTPLIYIAYTSAMIKNPVKNSWIQIFTDKSNNSNNQMHATKNITSLAEVITRECINHQS